jgi:tetratricopeptide (TPR) repeat protein
MISIVGYNAFTFAFMQFDPNNKVIQLCAEGMNLEVNGKPGDALNMYMQAWNIAVTDEEKFIAAHYVARDQSSIQDKLDWDKTALSCALKAITYKPHLPSLYLNIAKCYEDLHDYNNALENYKLALSFTSLLANDGYGSMIKAGIDNGLERMNAVIKAE